MSEKFFKTVINLGVITTGLSSLNFAAQLVVLYLFATSTRITDQFYLLNFTLGFLIVVFSDHYQTHYHKKLSDPKISAPAITNLLRAFIYKLLILSVLCLILHMIEALNIVQSVILFGVLIFVPFTIYVQQNCLFKKNYTLYFLLTAWFPVNVLLTALVGREYFINLLLTSFFITNAVIMLRYKIYKEHIKKSKKLVLVHVSLIRVLENIVRVAPNTLYIFLTAVILNYQFPGIISLYGLSYSLIGIVSVVLGQNLAVTILISNNDGSKRLTGSSLSVCRFIVIYLISIIITSVCLIIGAKAVLQVPYLLFLSGQIEFLNEYNLIVSASIIGFTFYNILRAFIINKDDVIVLFYSNSIGICTLAITLATGIFLSNLCVTLLAIPLALFLGNIYLSFNLSNKRVVKEDQ